MSDIATVINIEDDTHHVLIYQDDDGFAAVGLETDLMGHGSSSDKAVEELIGCVRAQYEHAKEVGDMSILDFPADRETFQRFQAAYFIETPTPPTEDKK